MPKPGSKRFTLADLVFAVVLCGTVMAVFVARSRNGDPRGASFLAMLTIVIWVFKRMLSGGEDCQGCGRRFFPVKQRRPLQDCRDCGARRTRLARSYRRKTFAFWLLVPVIPVFLVAAVFFEVDALGEIRPSRGARLFGLPIAAVGALAAILAMAWLDKSRGRLAKAEGRACEACGTLLSRPPGERICPACLSREQSPAQASKQPISGLLTLLLVEVGTGVFLLVKFGPRILHLGSWIDVAFLAIQVPLVILGVFFIWKTSALVLSVRRLGGIASVEDVIARARFFAGGPGRVTREGSAVVWYSGPEDPTPMILEEFASARRRFEALFAEPALVEAPPLCLAFNNEDEHLKFVASCITQVGGRAEPAYYLQHPWTMFTLCTTVSPASIADPRERIGGIHCAYLMNQVYGRIGEAWLNVGMIHALDARHRPGDPLRLNRRMVVALSSGVAWDEDLFSPTILKLVTMVTRSRDPKIDRKLKLFGEQSWSIVEYLLDEHAPQSRRRSFLAFLKDKTTSVGSEDSLFRHFGFGYGTLLESWREWVYAQGIGPDLPPPRPVHDRIVNRLMPVIRDTTASRRTRIEALRDWRRHGYILGADLVIALLRDPGGIPKAEIAWALAMVSGRTLGDDPDRWQAWWDETPAIPDHR